MEGGIITVILEGSLVNITPRLSVISNSPHFGVLGTIFSSITSSIHYPQFKHIP